MSGADTMRTIKDCPGFISDDGLKTQTLYIRGVTKTCTFEDIVDKISVVAVPIDTIIESSNTHIWAQYDSIQTADDTLDRLHQLYWRGKYLAVKFELGINAKGERIPSKYPGNKFLIRHVRPVNQSAEAGLTAIDRVRTEPENGTRKDKKSKKKGCAPAPVTYNSRSISVGEIDYPFPTGAYSARVLAVVSDTLTRSLAAEATPPPPLLHVLTDQRGYARTHMYVKELSEAMAMVDGLQRALNMLKISNEALRTRGVRVFCLGDGASCLCGACISVFYPLLNAEIYSIDPILLECADSSSPVHRDELGNFRLSNADIPGISATAVDSLGSFHRVPMMSQAFTIPLAPTLAATTPLDVVIACHSHAPLEEFWGRLTSFAGVCNDSSTKGAENSSATGRVWSKVAISMNCCAQYCILPALTPLQTYDDFEVYSPKRTVRIYAE